MKNRMNVLYFCSDMFLHVAAVSIVSLLENNKNFEKIIIYIIDDGISEGNKKKLEDMVDSYHRDIEYIDAPDPCEFFKFPFKSRYQMGHSYMRMCIGSLLPKSVEKVLCLDSDTLITDNLTQLWETDMTGNILAGVADCVNLKAFSHQFMLSVDDIYCNAGVFLVNLIEWRNQGVEDIIRSAIKEHNGNIFFFEQTLMNYACAGKIIKLPAQYNSYTLFYAFTYENLIRWRRPTNFYTEVEIHKAKQNPYIIHFTRNFYMTSRPWVKGCGHPLTEIYQYYKGLTPWTKLDEDNRSKANKIKYILIHHMPQSLLAYVVNVMYNVVRPLMRWKNE